MVKERDARPKGRKASRRIIHTSKKHRIQAWIALAILVICYVACSAFYVGYKIKNKPVFEETDFDESLMDATVRPTGAKLTDIVIPDADDEDAMIACALKLYNKANYNLQHDDKVAYAVHTSTKVMGVETGGIRYAIKNGNEFFNADYFYVPADAAGSIAKGMSQEYANYGYRQYYNISSNIGHEQKAKELSYIKKSNGQILFSVGWDKECYFDRDLEEIPAEFAASGKSYKYYNYTWDTDTIKSATVTYNAQEGYYEMVVELDATNKKTVKDGIQDLIDGTQDKEAYYTKIVETVQIWDNGRYKMFNTYDDWLSPHIYGMKLIKNTKSANDYKTTFYYDDYSLTINNYQYAKDYIESLTK